MAKSVIFFLALLALPFSHASAAGFINDATGAIDCSPTSPVFLGSSPIIAVFNINTFQFVTGIEGFFFSDPVWCDVNYINENILGSTNIETINNTIWYVVDNFTDFTDICLNTGGAEANYLACDGIALASATFIQGGVTNGSIWGENGMFGTTNVPQAVAASVQQTGASFWPLISFVGIPIAVVIALLVMQNIVTAAGARRRRSVQNFDFEKADALKEFYSRDGGIDPALKNNILKNGEK